MLVSIHQPNFFPWAGYFHKIIHSDKFIILDNVQFQKKGGTYGNRAEFLVNGQAKWVTMPVDRSYHGYRNINEITINDTTNWRKKVENTIAINYSKSLFFAEIFPTILECINYETPLLSEFNIHAIKKILTFFNSSSEKLLLSSNLSGSGHSTDLLISLIKEVNGSAYMCGGGAINYQEDEKFSESSIKLVYQNFSPPKYSQFSSTEFIPGLSILDMLFNCGVEKTFSLLKTFN